MKTLKELFTQQFAIVIAVYSLKNHLQFPLLFFRLTGCSFAVNTKTSLCTFFSLSLRNFCDLTNLDHDLLLF